MVDTPKLAPTSLAGEPALLIFDAAAAFIEAPELDGAIVHFPQAVRDRLEADGFFREHVTDVDPRFLPADATVPTDLPQFEVARILEWFGRPVIRAGGRLIAGRGWSHAET